MSQATEAAAETPACVRLSLGLETMGGAVNRVIPRGTPLPTSATEIFTTFVAGETAIEIHVVQGERTLAADCLTLARFLVHIRPHAAGIARIGIKFAVSADGTLQVTGTDLRTGESQSASIMPLSDQDADLVSRMLAEAERWSEADRHAQRLIDLRNEASTILAGIEEALLFHEGLAPPERRILVEAIDRLRSLLAADDALAMKDALATLNHAAQPLVALMLATAPSVAKTGPLSAPGA